MATYRVHAKCTLYLYMDIEANSYEEAKEMAEEAKNIAEFADDTCGFVEGGYDDWEFDYIEKDDGDEWKTWDEVEA